MRLWLVAQLLSLAVPCCSAMQPESNPASNSEESALTQLPACAVRCMVQIYSSSPCLLTDVDCMCKATAYIPKVDACVLAACTLQEALSTKNITATACHLPVHNKTRQYVVVSITLGTLTIVCVLTRLIFKRFWSTNEMFGTDDWVLCAALVLRIACMVLNVQGLAANGFGKDIWTLPPEEIISFVKQLFIMIVLYLAEISLMKLVLALFFLRLFIGPIIHRVIWATIAANILFGVVLCTTAIFQCKPISHYWKQYAEYSTGHCIDANAFGWANASISVAIDLWMLSIPLSQIQLLKLHWSKKLVATVMFLLGSFVTVISILRLRFLVMWANSANPTFEQFDVIYWSTIEVNVGLICACLPAFRLILARIFPRVFRGSSNASAASGGGKVQSQPSKLSSKLTMHRHATSNSNKSANERAWELSTYNQGKKPGFDLKGAAARVEGASSEEELVRGHTYIP